ncbi:MAG: hypothetical protein M5U28_26010 [Sandaracinaceae bacterium]|nr:hypothetical protein [Sandaracinaceae bacterium]
MREALPSMREARRRSEASSSTRPPKKGSTSTPLGPPTRARKCPGKPMPSTSTPARRPTAAISTASVRGMPVRRVITSSR